MSYSARPFSTNSLQELVNQTAHGFTVGTPITFNGSIYILALADNYLDCFNTVIVSVVIDANNFYFTQTGYIASLQTLGGSPTTYIPGEPYYLSDLTAGLLTLTPPVLQTHILLPCFLPDTATSGTWFGGSGTEISAGGGGSSFVWINAGTSRTMAINSGYFVTGLSQLVFTMPSVFNLGDTIKICDQSGNGFIVAPPSPEIVTFAIADLSLSTTAGTGTITSTINGNSLEMVCVLPSGNANPTFRVISSKGAFVYA